MTTTKNMKADQKLTNITIYRREVYNYLADMVTCEYLFSPAKQEKIYREGTDLVIITRNAAEPCGTFSLYEGKIGEIAESKVGDCLLYIEGEAMGYTARELVLGACACGEYTPM